MCMSVVCAQKGVWGVQIFLDFSFVLGPLGVGGPIVHEQCDTVSYIFP